MARSQARAVQPAGRSSGSGGGRRFYVLIAVLLPTAVVLLPSFMILAAAMVPALVAWMIDIDRRKYMAMTVAGLNFAGSLYFLGRLWSWSHDIATAIEVMGDVFGWLIAYAAAAAGYGVYYTMPMLSARLAEFKAQHRLAKLERAMGEIVEEWGEAVTKPPAE